MNTDASYILSFQHFVIMSDDSQTAFAFQLNFFSTFSDHFTRKDIRSSYEIGNKFCSGRIINLLRRCNLLESSIAHDCYCIRYSKGFLLVMGNIKEGYSYFLLYSPQFYLHIFSQFPVK